MLYRIHQPVGLFQLGDLKWMFLSHCVLGYSPVPGTTPGPPSGLVWKSTSINLATLVYKDADAHPWRLQDESWNQAGGRCCGFFKQKDLSPSQVLQPGEQNWSVWMVLRCRNRYPPLRTQTRACAFTVGPPCSWIDFSLLCLLTPLLYSGL